MHSTRRSSRFIPCAILAAAMAMPAFAQGTGTGTTSGSTDANAESSIRGDNEGRFDWGWLGLLGLAGLFGLRKRPDNLHGTDAPRSPVPR